jgi:ABC-type xylose transport system permease subunit
MNLQNLKDTLTTIAGVVFAVCGAIMAISASGVVLPEWLTTTAVTAVAISGALIGYFTGKLPDGTKKTPEQVATALKIKEETK